ncbi:MAG: phasin family protein [Halothece sp.]|jgi:polyhydroxyalkanoate synthesis regulator phasin
MSNQFGFGDILQKAFYFGVGLADYAQEQATEKFKELRTQSQKLADELVKRGEMNSEEARQFVEELLSEAQRGQSESSSEASGKGEPRRIEIIEEDEPESKSEQSSKEGGSEDIDTLREQVEALREELKRLHKN